MEGNKSLMSELIGKTVSIKTHEGAGTKDASLVSGEYKGIVLDFDGTFIKLEYDIRKFARGATSVTKDVILINAAYVITIGEYRAEA